MRISFSFPKIISLLTLSILTAFISQGCLQKKPEKRELPPPIRQTYTTPSQVTPGDLKPGLATIYLDKFYRTLDQMPKVADAGAKGRAGQPILQLNHKYNKDELIFGSGEKLGLGMVLTGYLHLAKPGVYQFQAISNDGIEFVLDGKLLFIDPTVHKDRLSPIGIAEVEAGGWYPVAIRYFQRKGTATLKFFWQPPGADEFSIIPEQIYRHN